MQIDIDYHQEDKSMAMAELRIYGITEEGYSVMARVTGFRPYFWLKAPANMPLNSTNIEAVIAALNVRHR